MVSDSKDVLFMRQFFICERLVDDNYKDRHYYDFYGYCTLRASFEFNKFIVLNSDPVSK